MIKFPSIDQFRQTVKEVRVNHDYKGKAARMSIVRKGRKLSEETKQKMSASRKGVPKSKEHNEKVRQALLGRKRKPETILKMSLSNKGKKQSEETKLKRRQSLSKIPKKVCDHCGRSFNSGNYQKHINKL